jgi:serine/threonine protein phosphatase PrpC
MIQSFNIISSSVTDRGLSQKRPQNEDAFLEMPKCGIYAVADGVGGAQAGEVASQMAMEILGEAFINGDKRSDAESVMRTALKRANSAINQMSQELPQLAQMATTVVALHLIDGIATIGHAGDSRLYRLDGKGVLHRETADHSVVAEEVRAGRMTEEQAENHPGKNIINRALGAEPTVEIDTKTIMITEPSTFLICSDGVTRHINDAEIAVLLSSSAEPKTVCGQIKAICYERGAEDNLTAVVIRLAESGETFKSEQGPNRFATVEETTAARARAAQQNYMANDEDDDLLEIETAGLVKPSTEQDDVDLFDADEPLTMLVDEAKALGSISESSPEIPIDTSVAVPLNTSGPGRSTYSYSEDADPEAAVEAAVSAPSVGAADGDLLRKEPQARTPPEQAGLAERTDGQIATYADKPTGLGFASKVLSTAALLLLGSLIGLGAYHFFLADRSVPTAPPITEIKGPNQPQTAFEENRRTLDQNPEAALPRYEAEPKDAENTYLLGRTYLLLGRYPEARKAFQESRELVGSGEVDPNNARTILTEIAIAMAVTNDTLIQNSLKKELDETRAASSISPPTTPTR